MLAHTARTYDRGVAQVTMRRNFQFNWPALETALGAFAGISLRYQPVPRRVGAGGRQA